MPADCSNPNLRQVLFQGRVWNKATFDNGFNRCRLENPQNQNDFTVARCSNCSEIQKVRSQTKGSGVIIQAYKNGNFRVHFDDGTKARSVSANNLTML